MPKRRPPGPSPQNRRRRRRDSAPNLPSEQYTTPDEVSPESPPVEAQALRPSQAAPAARSSMRPTMRRGFVPGAGRIAPAPAIEADYRYVVQDLRQIGILAGAGIAILIALSFILQ
jgi:hypothetical protein